jgi:predicted O-methyltransferase YrrM
MTQEWSREGLLDLSASFMECRILLSAAQLDLFSRLKTGPKTMEEIAQNEGWDPRGLRILMDALTALGILHRSQDGQYGLPSTLIRLLAAGEPESILPMILHRGRMWESWSHITDIVKTGQNPNPLGRGSRSQQDMEDFIGAMHVIGGELAEQIAASVDLSSYRRMLDLGGASGTYIMAFLRRNPLLTATLFDLPEVVEMARKRLTETGFIDRVQLVAGDYHVDELPRGHDLVFLSAVIHSHSREVNVKFFRRICDVLDPGGAILIRDHFMDASRTVPVSGAIFAVNMLAATSGGDSHSYQDVEEDLTKAGFKDVRLIREGTQMDQLVTAVKGEK